MQRVVELLLKTPLRTSPANKNQEENQKQAGSQRPLTGAWSGARNNGWGCITFEIDKGRFCFRLTAPYSEERREAARKFAREHNTVGRLKDSNANNQK